MSRKTYVFELVAADGTSVRRVSRRCTNMSARERAQRLLRKTPGAAAAFGYEVNGISVHAAYRD